MKKFLLAGVIALAPFAAFANQMPPRQDGTMIAGNAALTGSLSAAGVQGSQSTTSGAMVRGDGAVVVGTVAGNKTTIATTGKAMATPMGSATKVQTTQTNVGSTVSFGKSNEGRGFGNLAAGTTGGAQQSAAAGGSIAAGANLGVVLKAEQPRPARPTGRH